MKEKELKKWLDEYYDYFDRKSFIPTDPIQVPHAFESAGDIEIAAFLTAVIAWGQRPVIIKNATWLVDSMPDGPYQFILHAGEQELEYFSVFRHRTFNGTDCVFFLRSLQNIYKNCGGLKEVFSEGFNLYGNIPGAIRHFRNVFFSIPFPERSLKHLPDLEKNAAAKRINMFLRWMIRRDERGVDFGLWDSIPPSALYIPLDVHSGKVARELGLLRRKQNDWKAVSELTLRLRTFDRDDPVKYDFALFGISALEKWVE